MAAKTVSPEPAHSPENPVDLVEDFKDFAEIVYALVDTGLRLDPSEDISYDCIQTILLRVCNDAGRLLNRYYGFGFPPRPMRPRNGGRSEGVGSTDRGTCRPSSCWP